MIFDSKIFNPQRSQRSRRCILKLEIRWRQWSKSFGTANLANLANLANHPEERDPSLSDPSFFVLKIRRIRKIRGAYLFVSKTQLRERRAATMDLRSLSPKP